MSPPRAAAPDELIGHVVWLAIFFFLGLVAAPAAAEAQAGGELHRIGLLESATSNPLADAFGTAFWVALGLVAAALVPALSLPRLRSEREPVGESAG